MENTDYKSPIVSVIIPVYGVERELTRCVNSVLCQTLTNIEIILVDDGSPDSCPTMCDEFAENDNRVVVIHKKNGGLSSARNAGLDIATGKYISFVDSDDFIEKNMLEIMVDTLVKTNASICVCGRIDEYYDHACENFTVDKMTVMPMEETFKCFLSKEYIDSSACDKIYKSELWDTMRFPLGVTCEDVLIILDCIINADRIVHVKENLYHYCHRNKSITSSISEKRIKDYYYSICHVENVAKQYFPNISLELTYYLNISYLSLIMMCDSIGYMDDFVLYAKEYLLKNWKNEYSYNRVSNKEKLAYMAIKFNVYRILKRIKELVRR